MGVDPEFDDDEGETHWWTGVCECGICGYRSVGVIEIHVDQDSPVVNLECSQCGNMSCHPE